MGLFVAGTDPLRNQATAMICSPVTEMPVAVGTNAGATPRLVYPGSREREQFRI